MLCISITEVLFLWIPFNAAYHLLNPTSVLCHNCWGWWAADDTGQFCWRPTFQKGSGIASKVRAQEGAPFHSPQSRTIWNPICTTYLGPHLMAITGDIRPLSRHSLRRNPCTVRMTWTMNYVLCHPTILCPPKVDLCMCDTAAFLVFKTKQWQQESTFLHISFINTPFSHTSNMVFFVSWKFK